jgi:hypothetical protein
MTGEDVYEDPRLMGVARGANLLMHEGYGHSTWPRAIEAAERTGVE